MNTEKKYTYIHLSPKKVLVISATWERPDVYWNDLQNDLANSSVTEVFFDFLLKNGNKDRFYKATLKDGNILVSTFKSVSLAEKYTKISNKYFSNNWNLIESSLLTNFQKFKLRKCIGDNTM